VVSAGSPWYVERVLKRAGVAATIYSDPGRLENGGGFVLEKLDPSSPRERGQAFQPFSRWSEIARELA
jgi:hypothetical protein